MPIAREAAVTVSSTHPDYDPGAVVAYHQETEPPPARANRPIEIEPRLSEVERVLRERR